MKVAIIFPKLRGFYARAEFWDHSSIGEIEMVELNQIMSLLKSYGHDVENFEMFYKNKTEKNLDVILETRKFDLFALQVDYDSMINVTKMSAKIRKKHPNAVIAIFGYYPAINHNKILQIMDDVDLAFIGPDEKPIVDLCECIEHEKDWRGLTGIAYRNKTGDKKVISNTPSTKYSHFENMPWVKRGEGPLEKVEIRSTTGCTSNCIFCEIANARRAANFHDIRTREVEDVVAEIEYLIKNKGTKVIKFQDESFLLYSKERTEWLKKFISMMKEKNLKCEILGQARVLDILNYRDLLLPLKEVGLSGLLIGAESLVQSKLDFFRKGTTVQQNIEALHIVEELKIHIGMGYMLFDPFVNIDEIRSNLNILVENGFYKHILGAGSSYPFPIDSVVGILPACELYYLAEKDNLINRNQWFGYNFKNEDVQNYYDICCRWGQECSQINSELCQINTSDVNKLSENETGKKYLDVANKIKKKNVDKLIELCYLIERNKCEINVDEFIQKWENEKEDLYVKYNQLKQQIL